MGYSRGCRESLIIVRWINSRGKIVVSFMANCKQKKPVLMKRNPNRCKIMKCLSFFYLLEIPPEIKVQALFLWIKPITLFFFIITMTGD